MKKIKKQNHLNKGKIIAITLTGIFLLVGVVAFALTAYFQKWDVIGYLKSPQAFMIYSVAVGFILIATSLFFGFKEIK